MSELAFRPNKTSFAIMQLIHGYFSATGKPWSLIDQQWILEHLEKWHGVRIARSTLNYNLKILREQGVIETITRHKRDKHTGHFVCQVTLYKATRALKRFFGKLASYFKRCRWVPDIKTMEKGHVPAVGRATSKEAAFDAVLDLKRERRRRQ